MTLLLIVLLPFIGALIPPLVIRRGRTAAALAAGAAPVAALSLLIPLWPTVRDGGVPRWRTPWLAQIGLEFDIRLDGLAFLFAALVLGIGVLIVIYARYYLSERDPMGRFFSFLLLFMGAMTGLALSGNLLLSAIFWELTSLSSFLLIGYWTHRADARDGARTALTVTGLGGLALLGGVLLIGRICGSFDLDVVLASGALVKADPLYPLVLTLVLLGAFTKSAQVPFHFWLPGAMAAPTPVSAYLHSATMVKAGVFLLARLFPVLAGTDLWFTLVVGAGLLTLVVGAYAAMFQNDLKGLLAYSTISHLGLITLLFGFGTTEAAVAALFHLMNHAAFKASLFMAAGIIDHETGTRDMRTLNGLWKSMPYTGVLAVIAAAAMAGVPLFNGFLSKEMFFTETLAVPPGSAWRWLVPAAATLYGVFSVTYSIRFVYEVFFSGPGTGMPKEPHEAPRWMRIPVEVLAVLCIAVGVVPNLIVRPMLMASAAATTGQVIPPIELHLWHGFNLPLLMTALALVGGYLLFRQLNALLSVRGGYLRSVNAKALFDDVVYRVIGVARLATRRLETGSLQRYVLYFLLAAIVVATAPVLRYGWPLGAEVSASADVAVIAGWVVLVGCAIGTVVWRRQRLVALIVVSGVGVIVTLAFARVGAPDLALTQLLVEVVTTMLLLLALHHLPQEPRSGSSRRRLLRDGGVALVAGGGMAAITWAILTRPLSSISSFFLEVAKPEAGGTNVVNVILVDFRGFDTLGEVAVIGIAALGVTMMLDGLHADPHGRRFVMSRDRTPLILTAIARPLLPFALLMSVYIFLRGHNMPGGGFIAAILTAIAIMLQFMANGIPWTRDRLQIRPQPVIAWGIMIAVATGVASMLFGSYFLDLAHVYVHIPLIGEVELASAIFFDLGVYLTVVAAVILMLTSLGALSSDPTQPDDFSSETNPWHS